MRQFEPNRTMLSARKHTNTYTHTHDSKQRNRREEQALEEKEANDQHAKYFFYKRKKMPRENGEEKS